MQGRVIAPGVLDLSNMPGDQTLIASGINPPGHPKALPQIGEVLWKMARSLEGMHIHTLSLRGNHLLSLRQLNNLPLNLPHIRALDLSDNEGITHWKDLDVIVGKPETHATKTGGLKELQEIKLDGTALKQRTLKEGTEKIYFREMLNRFPNLLLLDAALVPRVNQDVTVGGKNMPISQLQMSAMQSQPFTWPCDVMPGYRETPEIEAFVIEFLAKFFPLFDADRTQLLPVYAPDATLSVSATTIIPPRARVANYHFDLPNQTKLVWSPYIDAPSRNLMRVGNDKRIRSLVKADHHAQRPAGQMSSLERWLTHTLPKSEHPLSDQDKWVFDAIDMGEVHGIGRVLLTVHGEFAELPSKGLRSFSRTFILVPAPPGSPAAMSGWASMILSDAISVRNYCGSTVFKQSLAVGGATVYQPGPSLPPPTGSIDPATIPADIRALPDKTPEQMMVIAQVQQQTNLTTQMALNCAEVAGYDLMAALNKFHEVKAGIPPDAFRS